MMALRRRVRTRLGDIDITQPIDISSSLSTYAGGTPSLMLPPPPITTSVVSPTSVSNLAVQSELSAENLVGQQAALNQGILSPSTAALWLQQNGLLVLGGLGVLGVVMAFSGGRRRR